MGQDDEYRVYFLGPDGDWKCEYIIFGGSGLLTRSGEQIIGFLEICSMNLGKSTSSCINKFKPNSLFVSFCTVDGNGLEMEFQSDEHRTAFVDQFECAKCQCRSKAVEENSGQSGSGNSGYRASMMSTRSSQQSREGNWARILLQDDGDSGSPSKRESASSKDSKPRKSSSSKSRKSSSSKSRKSKQSRKSSGSKSGDSNDGGSGDSENGGSENPKDGQSGDSKEGDDEKPRQEPRQSRMTAWMSIASNRGNPDPNFMGGNYWMAYGL